jgi:hypothetical protein
MAVTVLIVSFEVSIANEAYKHCSEVYIKMNQRPLYTTNLLDIK